jgi:DEAD/DEAH box helicase domain-containing protein
MSWFAMCLLWYYGKSHFEVMQFGFHKIRTRDKVILETCDLTLPPMHTTSDGIWVRLCCKSSVIDGHAIHAAQHVLVAAMAEFLGCGRDQLKTTHYVVGEMIPFHIIVYAAAFGAVAGLASVPAVMPAIVELAIATVSQCACIGGCLACVLDGTCPEHNVEVCKDGALRILRILAMSFT